jgi:hypothetical protein
MKEFEPKIKLESGVEALRKVLPVLAKGQMNILNQDTGITFCGQLKNLTIDESGKTFTAEFVWLAESNSHPQKDWKNSDIPLDGKNFEWDLNSCSIVNIGPGTEKGIDCWLLTFFETRELVAIHPPDGERLDPALVEGLDFDSR